MPPYANGTTDEVQEYPLSAYVQAHLNRSGASARQMARGAIDPETGNRLQHGWISALAKGDVPRAPELWRFRALAAAMSTPEMPGSSSPYRTHLDRMVRLAAAQWLGLTEVVTVETAGGDTITVTVPANFSAEQRADLQRWAEIAARGMQTD